MTATDGKAPPLTADEKYEKAMVDSGELLEDLRTVEPIAPGLRAVLAGLWAHRRNIPFLATVYEASQEMRAPLEQKR